jgi:hypothetical protein
MSDELTAGIPGDRLRFSSRDRARAQRAPTDWVRAIRNLLLTAVTLYAIAFMARAYMRNYFIFLPNYMRTMMAGGGAPLFHSGPTHVFVLLTDHFEPLYSSSRVVEWSRRYAALAARHHDSVGRPPQHTFFYPGEQFDRPIYEAMRGMTEAGYGEVELHYHHGYDTVDSLRDGLKDAIEDFQQFGFLKTVDGKTAFAFVHGNWGLDNSNTEWLCGVEREIDLLHELGCFADFTFPSIYEDSQPSHPNLIYATRDSDGPKSYEQRLPLTSLADGTGQLMMFQGPLIFSPTLNAKQLFLHLENGDIHGVEHATRARVDDWIRANVHVPQRPDWVFVKLFAHGASTPEDMDAVLGPDFETALSYLEREYNDGTKYVLHYITAREAYNLARSAGEGKLGEPQQYLDAYIKPYVAGSKATATRTEH